MNRRRGKGPLVLRSLYALALLAGFANVGHAQTSGSWNIDASGTWSTSSNWAGNIIANGTSGTATFGNDITQTRTITLGSNRTIGNLVFSDNGAAGSSWILDNSSAFLTLGTSSGTPTITTITDATITGPISGTQGLTKSGAATLTLNTGSFYTGTTTINAGTIVIGNDDSLGSSTTAILLGDTTGSSDAALLATALANGSSTISRALTIRAGSSGTTTIGGTTADITNITGGVALSKNLTITAASGGTVAFSTRAISGGFGINKTGAGLVTYGITNTYTGATTISDGILRLTSPATLQTTSNLVLAGGIFETTGTFSRALGTGSNQVQWTAGGFGSTGSLTVNIGGAAQTMTWGGTNFIADGAALKLAYHFTAGTGFPSAPLVRISNPIDLGGSTRTVDVLEDLVNATTSSHFGSAEFAGALSNGGINKTGNGLLVLSGTNTYSGTTTISGGTLRAIGASLPSTSNVNLAGGMLESTGTFSRVIGTGSNQIQWTGSGGFSTNGSLTVTLGGLPTSVAWGTAGFVPDGSALMFSQLGTSLRFSNPINLNGAAREIQAVANLSEITGQISNGGLLVTGAGTLYLSAPNTFAGGVTISGGTLKAVEGTGLPTASNLALTASGTYQASGTFTRAVGTGAGQVQWTGSGGFGAIDADLTVNLGGSAQQVVWTTAGFVPDGQTLTFNSAKSTLNTKFVNPIDLNGATRSISVVNSTRVELSGVIGNGGLDVVSHGYIALTGTNTYTGTTTIEQGDLYAVDGVGLPTQSNLNLSLGGTLATNGTFTRSLGTGAGQFQWHDFAGFSAVGGNLTINVGGGAAPLVLHQGFVEGSIGLNSFYSDSKLTLVNPIDLNGGFQSIDVGDNTSTTNDFVELTGVISNGSLTKTGSGLLILSAANTMSGKLSAFDGVIQMNNAAAAQNATVEVWNNDGITFSAGIVNPTFGGLTSIVSSAGVALADLGGSPLTLTVGSNNSSTTFLGFLYGAGSLVKTGSGTLTLAGANVFTGTATISGGTLNIGEFTSGGPFGSITGDIIDNATLSFSRSNAYAYSGTISGTGVVAKTGNGTTTLSGDNSYSGGTTVSAGTLIVGHAHALGTGGVTVNGGTLTVGTGIAATTGGLTVGGATGSNVNVPTGTSLTSSGTVQITAAGTLTLAGDLSAKSFDRSAGIFTFTSGSLTVDSGIYTHSTATGTLANILTIDGTGNPLFAMVNGATATGVEAVIVDSFNKGQLMISSGSVLDVLGTQIGLGLVAGIDIQRGRAYVGYATGTGAATVTGTGSKWNLSNGLYVGYSTTGTLDVNLGGKVTSVGGFLGSISGDTGTATIDGIGSQWTNTGSLYVGGSGIGFLTVRNGAIVSNVDGSIGNSAVGAVGTATVTGAGSQWNSSTNLTVGQNGTGTLTVSAGGVASAADGYLGGVAGSSGTATIDGSGSKWINSATMNVGYNGAGSLMISAGGLVTDTIGTVNVFGTASSSATVTGTNSRWTNSGTLSIGRTGTGTLLVSAGGVVSNTDGYVGGTVGSSGTATITGVGSQWNNSASLSVGYNGTGSLMISAGGLVTTTTTGYIGLFAPATGSVTVTGTGSQWTLNTDVVVSQNGNGATDTADSLTIADGGKVTNVRGFLGSVAGSKGSALITGVDSFGNASQWINSGAFYVGTYGIGSLTVSAGGKLSNTLANIGDQVGSLGGATLTGAGSQWTMTGDLSVGNNGTGTLDVQAGAVVSNAAGYIGRFSGAVGTATVSGSGSQWNNSGFLYIGGGTSTGGTGTLNVTAGGGVMSTVGYLGYLSSTTATVTIDGTNSFWSASGDVIVGRAGTGTLNIQAGGVLSSVNGVIASATGGKGTVVIDGAGSRWAMSATLFLGNLDSGKITVQNGGRLVNVNANIGNSTGSKAELTVTGTGTTWNSTGNVNLGISSTSATLTVADGAAVTMSGSFTIQAPGTLNLSGGSLTAGAVDRRLGTTNFTGGTLTASSTFSLANGTGAAANILVLNGTTASDNPTLRLITSGAAVGVEAYVIGSTTAGSFEISGGRIISNTGTATTLGTVSTTSISRGSVYIGLDHDASGTATVAGAGSRWNNSGDLFVGYAGTGTLNIASGGVVTSLTGRIGSAGFGTGSVGVTGTGSQWSISSTLDVGTFIGGAASLTVGSGGSVTSTSTATVNLPGTLYLQPGGTFTATSLVLTSGKLNYSGGTLAAPVRVEEFGGTIIVAADASLALTAVTGGAVLIKSGDGTLALNGTNTYGGTTYIESGTFDLNGSLASDLDLNGNKGPVIFHGAGTVASGIYVSSVAAMSPGTSAAGDHGAGVGTLSTSQSTWQDGAHFTFDFARTDDGSTTTGISNWDLLRLTGTGGLTLTSSAHYTIDVRSWTTATGSYGENAVNPFDPTSLSYRWLWVDNVGGGAINGVSDTILSQFTFDTSHFYPTGGSKPEALGVGYFWVSQSGSDLYLNYSAVPEPGSMLLTAIAGLSFAAHRRRKNSSCQTEPCSEKPAA